MNSAIVAVFDSPSAAAAAARELVSAGIAESAISQHAQTGTTTASTVTHREPVGFWESLFGTSDGSDLYDRSIAQGATVVSVMATDAQHDAVTTILDRHDPVDMDERAASYGMAASRQATTGTSTAAEGDTLRLSEEQIAIGKRAVVGGTTRIRKYVVETPVEEQVSLRSERVTLERRPVTDGHVTGADFTEKSIEMTEMHEEAVVSKTARVTEEVALRKEATERVETVRDTVRREDVEIEQVPGGTTTGAGVVPPRRT